jgi:tetratricopeptide (TPR) repeat protein
VPRRRAALLLAALAACHAPPPAAPSAPLPRAALAHYLAGHLARGDGDDATAAAELTAAAAAAPDQPVIAADLARAQAKTGDARAADATLAAARRRWPGHPALWLATADLAAAAEDDAHRDDARRAYRQVLTLDPDEERAYLGLARLDAATDRGAELEATLRALVAHVPDSIEGHFRLAGHLATRRGPGDLAAATTELRAVLERDPDHLDARLELARALRRQGHLPEAIVETRSAFDRSSQDLDIADELYGLLLEADAPDAARDLLGLLDDSRSDAATLGLVAHRLRELGHVEEARELIARLTARDPDAGELATIELTAALGDRRAAATRALAVLEASPIHDRARALAAAALLDEDDPTAAAAALAGLPTPPGQQATAAATNTATATAIATLDADLALLAARVTAATDPAAARAQLLAARVAGPARDLALAHLEARLDEARVSAGAVPDPTAALAHLDHLLAAEPNHVAALALAGYLRADAGRDLARADADLTRARDLAPGDAAILDSWGWLELRRGHLDPALRALAHAHRVAPGEAEILLHLALAWAARGAPRTAADLLADALARRPPGPLARRIERARATLPPTLPPTAPATPARQ